VRGVVCPRARDEATAAFLQQHADFLEAHVEGWIRFTFFWPAAERWEGRDFAITVEKSPA